MTCRDIGEETYRQHERFYEAANHFHDRHQRQWEFQPPRHAWSVEDILIIMSFSCKVRDEKREQSEHRCHCYISCDISTEWEEWDKSEDIIKDDKEKHR